MINKFKLLHLSSLFRQQYKHLEVESVDFLKIPEAVINILLCPLDVLQEQNMAGACELYGGPVMQYETVMIPQGKDGALCGAQR